MDRLFLDTDVCLDLFLKADRAAFHPSALRLFHRFISRKALGFISPLTLGNLIYIMGKSFKGYGRRNEVLKRLAFLKEHVGVQPMGQETFDFLLQTSFSDLEDAMQYQCAVEIPATHIITRNVEDYSLSAIEVQAPEEYLAGVQG